MGADNVRPETDIVSPVLPSLGSLFSASAQSFDTSINSNSTDSNVPTSKAVKDYVSQEINGLDVASVGEAGSYIQLISEANGKISATKQAFDKAINANSTDNNAPTSKAVLAGLNTKVDKVDGKQLSTEDYTSTEKTKLSGIEAGAQKNTVTGVKGNSETSYRTGNVNITKANIGLGNVDNTADANKAVASAGKLTTARKVYVNLETASTTETKDFSGDTAIPVNGTLPIANGGTGTTSQENINKNFIAGLAEGSSDVTDGTMFVSSYASDDGFADTNAPNKPYKRTFLHVWNYIKAKFSIKTSGDGNAITRLSYSNGVFTATKGSTFLTSHQDISGKINSTSIAPAFSKTKSYAVGSYVTYNSTLYKCTTAHSASDWNANHFTAVAVIDSFPTIDSALSSTSTNAVHNI